MDKILKDLLDSEIADLAKEKFANFAKDAIDDTASFLRETEDDIKRWSNAVAAGQMSTADFEWLLKGKKDLAKMELLTKKGLAQIEIDKFRDAIIDLILKKLL